MTKRFLEFPMDDDQASVLVEVTGPVADDSGYEMVAGDSAIKKAQQRFQEAFDGVKPAIGALMDSLKDINNPAEIQVKLGLAINSEAKAFVAALGSEVNFEITLRWENRGR